MRLAVHDNPTEVASEVAGLIAGLVNDSVDGFTFGLAGGTTPRATYRALRGRQVDWRKVTAWLSDERWVPPDNERSNGLMAAEALFDHVDAEFFRPRWHDLVLPQDAAAHYEARIRSVHGDKRPDLVLLGMGSDGHTASLFPGTAALEERERLIVANEVPKLSETRLTATFPLLHSARRLLVLVTGEAKAKAVRDSFAGDTPAGRLADGDGEVEWHLDRAAASLVS